MLQLVLGRNYTDKTEYLRTLAQRLILEENKEVVFIIPEQFSYETEKNMLLKVGSAAMNKVEVLSLSRLAELCLEKAGLMSTKQKVDGGVRMLTMSLALEELRDRLTVFKKYSERPALTESLVSFATELKQCSVTTDELESFAESNEESSLTAKLSELSTVISLYNAMLDRDYYDPEDSLTVLSRALDGYKFFENKIVIIDEFKSFTKQEISVIEKIIMQSPCVYFSFHTDITEDGDDFSIFKNVNQQIRTLKNLTAKCNVKLCKPIVLNEPEARIDENLLNLEKNLFNVEKECFEEVRTPSVTLLQADDKTDECNFVALKIKKLLREGKARGRDIIVYQREKDSYDEELAYAFKKYGVPFYEDRRQPIESQPLIVYLRTLLALCSQSITTDLLMRFFKTGLTSLTCEEISKLENYAFVWQLKTSDWKRSFSENPRGYGSRIEDEEEKELDELNEIRRKAVEPLIYFKKEFDSATGDKKSEMLFEFLEKNNVREALYNNAKLISLDGREYLYEEQDAVWSLVCNMLDRLYLAAKDRNVSSKRYSQLFDLLLYVTDLGALPQGLDCVTVAAADRSRAGLKKYVFIVGANEGVFPKRPQTQGLLSDNDRIELRKTGIELAETAEYKQTEEKYIAYRAVCSATDGLFVSHCMSGLSGEAYTPGDIIREIKQIFPNVSEEQYTLTSPEEKVESKASAFEVYARENGRGAESIDTVYELLNGYDNYKGRLLAIERARKKEKRSIQSAEIATKLFGKNMFLTATRTETYHQCPFKFFCRYGIKAEPLTPASVDSLLSGTIIHDAFENILSEYKRDQLEAFSDDELKDIIKSILKKYLNEKMGGAENKTKRFLQQYDAIAEQVYIILKRLIEEFKTSEFVPVDFELAISPEKDIKPYSIKLDDGGSLMVTGSVDRVDIMEKNGKKYLRVIDYKTGKKTFKLNEVFYGLSTQMLIYLFAIYADKGEKYGEIVPSGIFYMLAKPADSNLDRNADQEAIDKKLLYSNKMNGMVVDDIEIASGMEKNLEGIFIPASLNKDGELTGTLISYENLMLLRREIDEVLKNTAQALHLGKIQAVPSKPKYCGSCDYRFICGYETGDEILTIPDMKHSEAIKFLREKYLGKEGENDG